MLDEKRRALLHSLAKDRTNSPAVIAATLGISRSSFYRYLAEGPPKPRAMTCDVSRRRVEWEEAPGFVTALDIARHVAGRAGYVAA